MTRCGVKSCRAADAEPVVRKRSKTRPLCAACRDELELFGRAGRALCGELWQGALGAIVGKDKRTIRSLWHGDRRIPSEYWPLLVEALEKRSVEMPELLDATRAKVRQEGAAS